MKAAYFKIFPEKSCLQALMRLFVTNKNSIYRLPAKVLQADLIFCK